MASGNSSTRRRKSSSSHKKKASKISSEVKRRRSRSLKRNKSKTIRRRDVSLSYSDEDSRSKNSVSISSSDSEDDYRSRRRARSRTRKDEKGSRKRVRRSSFNSSEDSRGSPHQRKKKGSKQNEHSRDSKKKGSKRKEKDKDGSLTRKKTHKVKPTKVQSQRRKSVDSVSSGSKSISSEEREYERSRGRSEGREKKSKRSSGKMSNERDNCRSRSRSGSYSPRSGYSNENRYHNEERENFSKRIRSVLTVGKGADEAEERDHSKDDNKVEVIQAYDDCPSSRSNDSYDGGRKKDSFYHTHDISERKRKMDDLKVEETFNSKTRTTDLTKCSNEDPKKCEASTRIDSPEGKDMESILRRKALEKFEASTGIDSSEANNLESILRQKALGKFEASTGIDSSEANDLESILRQKALENLKKFRGGLNTNVKTVGVRSHVTDTGVKQPSPAKVDTTEVGIHKEAGRVAGAKEMTSQDIKNAGMPTTERKSATSKDGGRILDNNHNQHESREKPNTTHVVLGAENSSLDQVAGKATEKDGASVGVITNKPTQDTSRIREESSSDHSILSQTPATQTPPMKEFIEHKPILEKNVAEIPNPANEGSIAHVAEISKACESAAPEASSCNTPVSGELGSNEPEDVAKGSSQFEQKTMSVMRGGEMVQVKYKVYIPKKPPALARRKLQR